MRSNFLQDEYIPQFKHLPSEKMYRNLPAKTAEMGKRIKNSSGTCDTCLSIINPTNPESVTHITGKCPMLWLLNW